MVQKQKITQLPNAVFQQLNWDYFISSEAADYLTTDLVVLTEAESEAFYEAANHLYELFVATAERILQEGRLEELGIPTPLYEMIHQSWRDDAHLHLFGRFDFAGGVAGLPIKLIEFNADTPTSLPETAIIQWAQLKANHIPDENQFNFVFESLTEQFRKLKELNPDKDSAILFSTLKGSPEDDNNVSLLSEAAHEAGFEVRSCYMDEVVFSESEGVFAPLEDGNHRQFPFWFKLVPWEFIATEEPELCEILTKMLRKNVVTILNPAYTMIFQSKAIMKFLWEYYPNDPYLLETTLQEPIGRSNYAFVQKVVLGREGANVSIHDDTGIPIEVRSGDYGDQISVYQALAQLAQDEEKQYYQAGVFMAFEACGLGFRRSPNRIIDNGAQFVGHTVQ